MRLAFNISQYLDRLYSPILNILAFGLQIVEENIATSLVGVGISIDSVDGLLRANHVVIEVKADCVCFVFGEMLAIVERANQTDSIMRKNQHPSSLLACR